MKYHATKFINHEVEEDHAEARFCPIQTNNTHSCLGQGCMAWVWTVENNKTNGFGYCGMIRI